MFNLPYTITYNANGSKLSNGAETLSVKYTPGSGQALAGQIPSKIENEGVVGGCPVCTHHRERKTLR